MPLYTIIILALVQGITEFLPISSSGHLVLTHRLLGDGDASLCWEQDRMMDIAVHVGTLFSVLLYFRKDLCGMLCACTQKDHADSTLGWLVILACLPVIAAGYLLHLWQPSFLCLVEIMAWMTLLFGVVLWWADKRAETKTLETMDWKDALLVGLAQTLALTPGVSRSGITMTAARALGYSRTESARFSLFLAIITITGAGALTGLDLAESGNFALTLDAALAAGIAFVTGYAAIWAMMKWLQNASFKPFAIYRIILGIALLAAIYAGWL